jgi:hypothetical protein
MNALYDRVDAERLRADLRAGRELVCPVCSTPLERRAVEPRTDVAYVRSRWWLHCGGCSRSLVLDAPRPGRP